MCEPRCISIDKEKITIDNGELKRRLSVSKEFDVSAFDGYVQRMLKECTPKACFVRVPVSVDESGAAFPFGRVESRDLAKNLCGCSEAFVFAVTLGHGCERFLSKVSHLSAADFFVYDAIGSSLAESVCDEAERIIKGSLECKPRFSPGYGDFPLENQREVLSYLGAEKHLGITLTESKLMIPQKSITAILAVNQESGMRN